MTSGRLFQVRGPATANDLPPNEVCVHGTSSFPLSADLIPGCRSTHGWQNSVRILSRMFFIAVWSLISVMLYGIISTKYTSGDAVFGDVKMLRKFVWYYPSETFFYRCPHSGIWKALKAIHTCYCWHDICSKLLLEWHHRIFANHHKDHSYQQSVEAATALAVCLMCFICVLWSRLSQPEQRKQSSRAKIESAQVELHLQ